MWGTNFTEWAGSYCGWGSLYGHSPWFMGWLVPILFWGLIVYLVVSIIRHFFSNKVEGQNDSALGLLRNRFASGQISEREYLAQKTVLSQK